MHSRLTQAVGAVAAALAFAGPAVLVTSSARAATGEPTLFVNARTGSDGQGALTNTCRLSKRPCATIQHAVDIAPAAARIAVSAGIYDEQVLVAGKALTIAGAGAGKTIIEPSSLTVSPISGGTGVKALVYAIVTFSGTSGGGLTGVTVEGSQVQMTDCSDAYLGVAFADSSGTLQADTIRDVEHDPASAGCAPTPNGGVLVTNDDNVTQANGSYTVGMTKILVEDYTKDGITCVRTDTTCTISHSDVTGAGATGAAVQDGIVLESVSSASVTATTVKDNSYTSPGYATSGSYEAANGILATDVGSLTIDQDTLTHNDENFDGKESPGFTTSGTWSLGGNTITAATNLTGGTSAPAVPLGQGVGDGIDLTGTSSPVTIFGNHITHNADRGIALSGASNVAIGTYEFESDTISDNGWDGVFLGGDPSLGAASSGNSIVQDTLNGNGGDGIDVEAGSNDNSFEVDRLARNVRYDVEDLSTGSGTLGTANTWYETTCLPAYDSIPEGICG